MLNSGPNLAASLDGPPPFGQVASPAGRSHFEQLPARLLRLPDSHTADAGMTHVGTTFRTARIAGTKIRIRPLPQVGSAAGKAVQFTRTTDGIIPMAQVGMAAGKAAQVAGITVQFKARTAQVAFFGAGAPKTTEMKASEPLFRSQSRENPFPPIYQVANEMTETKRQAGAQRRRP